jgi:hypothetical protein
MLKKSIVISLSLFALFFVSSLLFQSCKCEEKVCAFRFQAFDFFNGVSDSLNTVTDDGIDTSLNSLEVTYTISHDGSNPACAWQSFGFNTAYAFTQYCEVLNAINPGSYFLKLDRDLVFNTITIPAGTDLMKQQDLIDHWNLETYPGFRNAQLSGTLRLDSATTQLIQFDAGNYKVEFGFSTDDGQNLNGTLDVVYKL